MSLYLIAWTNKNKLPEKSVEFYLRYKASRYYTTWLIEFCVLGLSFCMLLFTFFFTQKAANKLEIARNTVSMFYETNRNFNYWDFLSKQN